MQEQEQYMEFISGELELAEKIEAKMRWNNARFEVVRRSQRNCSVKYEPYGRAINEAERAERADAADNRARQAAAGPATGIMALPPSARASGGGEPSG